MLKYNITEVNEKIISTLITQHSTGRFTKLDKYYKGEHDILNREFADSSKPNNKIVANFAQYISDIITGYFIGQPITLNSKNKKLLTIMKDISSYNDQDSVNSDLALITSIKSKAYELLYLDQEQNIRSAPLNPENVIYVYNTSLVSEPALAIYYYWETFIDSSDEVLNIEAYTPTERILYRSERTKESDKAKDIKEISRTVHYWGQVPIIEYSNPADLGDFERVLTSIDAYNKLSSDSVNNFEYFADAYLLLTGMSGTDTEDVKNMKINRVIPLGEGSSASFLTKPSVEADVELLKDRLVEDIHTFSSTPNLRDKAFSGSASGISLKYKLNSLEQYVSLKERKFKKSIQRRLEMICEMLRIKDLGSFDYREISLTFTRNMPEHLKELAEVVSMLKDQVPEDKLLPILPFIDATQNNNSEVI